jgi:hypothetical protein
LQGGRSATIVVEVVVVADSGRRRALWLVALIAVIAVVGAAIALVVARRSGPSERAAPGECGPPEPARHDQEPLGAPADRLQQRALDELAVFTEWLEQGEAAGFIGEVGWPHDEASEQWNALADRWYVAAAEAGLWVTAWAAGEWWGPYELSVYAASESVALDTATPSAAVVERHRRAVGLRGVNVNGAEFGIGANLGTGTGDTFSNADPGTYGADWQYPSTASLAYLACRDVEVVRLPFRWERMQPEPGAGLDPAELDRLRTTIRAAGDLGLRVIPTVMNYGAYWLGDASGVGHRRPIGSPDVTVDEFADLWRRLVEGLSDLDAIVGWGLMNEPVDLPGGAPTWEEASQRALDAVRQAGDDRTVLVPGHAWSTVTRFPEEHPAGPWIDDSADAVRYEAHHYFDAANSGEYGDYRQELERAITER